MISCRLDAEKLLGGPLEAFGGPEVGSKEQFKVQFLVNDPRGIIANEAFLPGTTVRWAFWQDEVHVIQGGEAEVSFTLPPNHHKVVTKIFRKGDAYLILNGTRATFKVAPGEPYLHVCIMMPRMEYARWQLKGEY